MSMKMPKHSPARNGKEKSVNTTAFPTSSAACEREANAAFQAP